MELDRNLALALMYIGMLIFSPFAWSFFRTLARYLFNRYMASEILTITYKENNKIRFQVTVKTRSDGSITQKIREARSAKNV